MRASIPRCTDMSGGRRQSGEADPRNVGRIRLQEVLAAPAPAASRTPPGKAAARSVPGASPQGLGDADFMVAGPFQ